MKRRRILLVTGLGLLIVSAAHPAGAGVTGEVEVDGYGGRTSGGWICGPMGSVNYGGMAVKASIAQRDIRTPEGRDEGQGTVASLSGAFDAESVSIIHEPDPDDAGIGTAPPDRAMFGAQVNAGYRWRWIGIEGGAGLFEGWQRRASVAPQFAPYPDVELSFGLRDKLYGVLGGGSPFATSVLRPGIFTGGGFVLENKMAFDLRGGIYRQGPALLDSAGYRLDLAGRGPITDAIALRLGANIGWHGNQSLPFDYEGSAGLILGY